LYEVSLILKSRFNVAQTIEDWGTSVSIIWKEDFIEWSKSLNDTWSWYCPYDNENSYRGKFIKENYPEDELGYLNCDEIIFKFTNKEDATMFKLRWL